jgi:hypothetical protein
MNEEVGDRMSMGLRHGNWVIDAISIDKHKIQSVFKLIMCHNTTYASRTFSDPHYGPW